MTVTTPLCSVGRHRLITRDRRKADTRDALEEARQQWLFERLCARELLGELD